MGAGEVEKVVRPASAPASAAAAGKKVLRDPVEAAVELKLFKLRRDPKARERLAAVVAALERVRSRVKLTV